MLVLVLVQVNPAAKELNHTEGRKRERCLEFFLFRAHCMFVFACDNEHKADIKQWLSSSTSLSCIYKVVMAVRKTLVFRTLWTINRNTVCVERSAQYKIYMFVFVCMLSSCTKLLVGLQRQVHNGLRYHAHNAQQPCSLFSERTFVCHFDNWYSLRQHVRFVMFTEVWTSVCIALFFVVLYAGLSAFSFRKVIACCVGLFALNCTICLTQTANDSVIRMQMCIA